jgi:hypothetical protein
MSANLAEVQARAKRVLVGQSRESFIAAAHASANDVPALVAELATARADLARMAHPLDAELTRIREELAASAPVGLSDKVVPLLAELTERRAAPQLTAWEARELDRLIDYRSDSTSGFRYGPLVTKLRAIAEQANQ